MNKAGVKHRSSAQSDRLTEAVLLRIESIMDRLRLQERLALPFGTISVKMAALHGPGRSGETSKRYAANILLHLLLIALGAIGLSLVSGAAMLPAGVVLMLLYAWYSFQSLEVKVRQRKRLIVMELPELLNKLTLLINAGETIHQAIHRCAAAGAGQEHPLYREWEKLSRALQDNRPLTVAMEEFSRSCSVLEVSMFCTAVLINFRRGGSDFVAALQDLSHNLWERRKAMAKTIGEEASSKLVFPMVLLFCNVIVIVAAPALLMMS
ncbi:MAG: type secretion protein [Paenibacillaceae bacterium]|nr:type secretion protein [Paenibacillaceae bacterium]